VNGVRAGPEAEQRPRRVARDDAVVRLLHAAPRGPAGQAAEHHADAMADLLLPIVETALLRGPQPTRTPPAAAASRPRRPPPPSGPPPGEEAATGIRTPGEALAPAVVDALGPVLEVDLGPVRLHRGTVPARAAQALGAHAYTFGAHVVLGQGWAGPGTVAGRRLLAHELAHVAGQAFQGEARVQLETARTALARSGGTGTDVPPPTATAPAPFEPIDAGADVAGFLRLLPELVRTIAAVRLDAEATRLGVSARILQPVACLLYTENYIVIVGTDGAIHSLLEQDPTNPTMLEVPVVYLRERRSGRAWFLGMRGRAFAIQSFPRIRGVAETDRPAGESQLIAFMPGVTMPADLVRSLGRRARGRSGTSAEAPRWARDAAARQRRRVGGTGPRGEGPGAGQRGEGRGGGGSAEEVTSTTAGTTVGPATSTGATSAHEAPPAPRRPGPLRGPVRVDAGVSRTGAPQLTITIDRATTTVPLRDGESGASLDRRVDAAVQALQESRDPAAHEAVGQARTTGFAAPPPGGSAAVVPAQEARTQARSSGAATTPGERVPGGRTGANAPPYPSRITMAGVEPGEAAVSTRGATNRFTMALDYAALSLGARDEFFNRMQPIQFYWELIDVTGLTRARAQQQARATAVGQGERESALGALGTNLSRDVAAVAEDQQRDLEMMSEQNWPWQARAAYLQVIGLSNTVRLLGSVIGSFIDAVTQPLNERSIGFARDGDFLVRCVATPQWPEEAAADPEHHVLRASSIAVLPLRIASLGARAAEGADREATSIAAARAELAAALRSGNPRRIAAARAALEGLLAAGRTGGFEAYTQTLSALRHRLTVAHALQGHRTARALMSALSDDEVLLEIQLLQTRQSLQDYVAAAERQVRQVAGEGGEHETWVRRQHDRFRLVGGVSGVRPRLALASEENGQVSEIRTMLGELTRSREGARRWALVDITSSASRDIYVGESALPGHAGHVAAIRDTFRNFAENAGYGRGALAIRLPAELTTALGAAVPIDAAMRSAPGPRGRVMQRLRDLATVAEIAGLFATGGAGVAIGAVGGIAGAVTAIDSLARRARTGHVLELGTIVDVLGVVGGLAAGMQVGAHVARDVAEAGRAAGRLPSWINRLERTERALHIHGVIGNVQQLITIPIQLVLEWDEIDRATGLTEGERSSRRARALLGALRRGTVTVVSMGGGLGRPEEGTRPGRPGQEEAPLPAGTGAREAHAVAEGTGRPRPPVRGEPGQAREGEIGPATTDLVARGRALAAERLAAGLRARAPQDRPAAAGEERGTARPVRGAEERARARTAAGTARPARPGARGEGGDVNAAQRDLAVRILGLRQGQERPPGPVGPGTEPPRAGAFRGRTTSAEKAVAFYDQAVAGSRGAEVGLFFNPNTGEFAVQVGTEFTVRSPAGDGWQSLVHLHPNPENVIVRRLPAPADIAHAVRAALRTGTHTEFVQSTRPDGSTGITRVTVTADPARIVVEVPAAPGEPARRIEVTSPEAYAREYGSQTTYLDPTSPLYEWVHRDLDDFYRLRRQDADAEAGLRGTAEAGPQERTAMGTAGRPRRVPTQAESEALAEIARLRARLYAWRAAAGEDPVQAAYVDLHLAALRDLAAAARRGEPVEGALRGIREDLPRQRRVTRPVDAGQASALAARARRAARRSRDPDAVAELTRVAGEADRLAARMRADASIDGRTALDALSRQARRATRQDYEVYVDLGQPGERAQLMAWFEDHLMPLSATPVGELVVRDIMRHLETADSLTLAQSPRSAGAEVAGTQAMRRQVLDAIAAGRYSPEYRALFEAAARGQPDGWPRTPDGRAWEVDHVGELWLGGPDDASNYLALPPAVHELKSSILGEFRGEFRSRAVPGESRDVRETDEPEPPTSPD
jgi:hypothetical protein